jgi:hypothetical protein
LGVGSSDAPTSDATTPGKLDGDGDGDDDGDAAAASVAATDTDIATAGSVVADGVNGVNGAIGTPNTSGTDDGEEEPNDTDSLCPTSSSSSSLSSSSNGVVSDRVAAQRSAIVTVGLFVTVLTIALVGGASVHVAFFCVAP